MSVRSEILITLTKLRIFGIKYYLRHPGRLVNYGNYLWTALCERWPERQRYLYVFSCPLTSRSVENTTLKLEVFRSTADLKDFIIAREKEEPWWQGRYQRELERRFERGGYCFGAVKNGVVVSVLFVVFKSQYFAELDYTYRFREGSCGFNDGYTLLDFRGQGNYLTLCRFCYSYLAELGYEFGYRFVEPKNRVSLKVSRHFGHRPIELLSMHQKWGIRRHKIQTIERLFSDDELDELGVGR